MEQPIMRFFKRLRSSKKKEAHNQDFIKGGSQTRPGRHSGEPYVQRLSRQRHQKRLESSTTEKGVTWREGLDREGTNLAGFA